VYRFTWRSGFDGDAAVRIGRQGDQITLHWIYRWYTLRCVFRSNVITDSGGR
jgi:hypothetical protein